MAGNEIASTSPAGWTLNGRAALRHLDFGTGYAEIAVWARNLTDQDRVLFPVYLPYDPSPPMRRPGLTGSI